MYYMSINWELSQLSAEHFKFDLRPLPTELRLSKEVSFFSGRSLDHRRDGSLWREIATLFHQLIWLGGRLWCYCSTLLDLPFFFSSPVMPCNQFCSQFGMWNFFCWKALTIERVGSDGLGGFSSREASEAGAPVSPASAWPFAFSISKDHVFINFGGPCFLSSIFDKANLVVLFWFTFCCHSSLLLCKFSSQGFSWCLLKISAWFFRN